MLVGELHDVPAERRREQHRLALVVGRQPAQQKAQVGDEAHVEHAVGLVDDQHLGVAQRVDALLEVVDQPARRPDQHVDTAAQDLALLGVVDAAVHGVKREAGKLADALGILQDLHDQLARRRDDQCARAVFAVGMLEQAGEQGDEKGRRLAGTGLRLAGDVLARQRDRQRLFLNRRTCGESDGIYAAHHRFRNRQRAKVHSGLRGYGAPAPKPRADRSGRRPATQAAAGSRAC